MTRTVFVGGLMLALGFAAGYFVGVAQTVHYVLSKVSN
jgi:hypothetical protein